MAMTPAEGVVAAVGAAAGTTASFALNEAFRQYSGISLIALVASAGGSVAAFAYYTEPNRWKLFGMAAANTFFGAALVIMLPVWFGWDPVAREAEPAASFLLGAACRWLLPLAIDVAPAWIRRVLGLPAATPTPTEKPNEERL